MHLKRVEVENFKSFGRKLSIPFLEGFTAITGPNGSGKSNIGDAVLFVLGPKSNKAIRAGKLTDLIFNGGKEKKPAEHCKVSLVFDNKDRVIPVDEDEVTLSRVVKISKNNPELYYSHFYVNGRPSSLTEFDTLLAHSRISADGYNIVRQGDVLRIVEMSPLERRRILDDIAGITKFDEDIGKAEGEKTVVQQNLDRIQIVLDEIDRQLVTLEREREAALKHKALKEQLDLAKAKLARKRKEAIEADLASVHEQIKSGEIERRDLSAEIARLKTVLRQAEERLRDVENKMVAMGGPEAEELKKRIDTMRTAVVKAQERLNYGRDEVADLKKERAALDGDVKRVEKERAKYEKEAQALRGERDATAIALRDEDAKLDEVKRRISLSTNAAGDLQMELTKMKLQYEQKQAELHETKLSQERLTDRIERLKVHLGEQGEQLETVAFEIKDVDWELKELKKETQGTEANLQDAQKALFAKKKREAQLVEELRDLDPMIRRLQNEYAQVKAEQEAAEKTARGYTRAVDGVLQARDHGQLRGICGTIAELASVDDKYAVAMEIAAGGRMQAIVTETDEDAARAIEFLKANRLGRATFLPLTKMVPGRPAGRPLMAVRDPDAEGFAVDLIRFDDKYRAAFWYVFRDTVIVRSMTGARRLMGGVRLVTLDGDIIDAGGAMTGGNDATTERAKVKFGGGASSGDLDQISARLRATVEHQSALSAELMTLRGEIQEIESKLREGNFSASSKSTRIADLDKRRREFEAKHQALQEEVARAKREMADCEQGLADAGMKRSEIEETLARIEREREEKSKLLLKSTAKELAAEHESLADRVGKLREKLRDLESRLTTSEHSLSLVVERLQEIEAKIKKVDETREGHEKAMAEAEKVVETNEKELTILLEVESKQNAQLRALSEARDAAFKEKTTVGTEIGKVQDRFDVLGDRIAVTKGKVPLLEQSLAEAAFELSQYQVELPVTIPETIESLRNRVRSLENEMERLGAVNMLALDEYDRQSARKKDLEGEVARLKEERERLLTLVGELAGRKKEGFFKVFHEINKNFQEVFARLSDGGKAELMLEHPEDPFAGGLLMRSQPKGKKITRLEALSGGEKSLTSMAFIFAIQEYDPSPFYYLDEVDQNLDGINSELLARMVKENSRHNQVIMVSLRKVTLKEAEHVYGVTMMDSGISEVVGEVRLSEITEEPPRAPEVPA
ncbi:MAG TPA: chromosome segregation protein SMC [Candidatus Thermoplasmatota archaeon]|nr:chromosome segregation protein SMC [Candidatus Thermoplasmatota archaeon]